MTYAGSTLRKSLARLGWCKCLPDLAPLEPPFFSSFLFFSPVSAQISKSLCLTNTYFILTRFSTYCELYRYRSVIKKSTPSACPQGSAKDEEEDGCGPGLSTELIFRAHWFRIILDEAHTIKNNKSQSEYLNVGATGCDFGGRVVVCSATDIGRLKHSKRSRS